MKKGLYFRLAWMNISKNRKLYIPYGIFCIGLVMIYYIIYFLAVDEGFGTVQGGVQVQILLNLGRKVLIFVTVLLLIYVNNFLMKQRKREFGLFHILGMEKRHIIKLLLWENIITAGSSLIAGLGFGILLSKLCQMFLLSLMDTVPLENFAIPVTVIRSTFLIFVLLFFIIFIMNLLQIARSGAIELLKSSEKGEKEPRANYILAVFGLGFLGAGYYLAVTIRNPLTALMVFFIAVLCVVIGTYFLMIAGSVALCKILRRNKRYYYKSNHFVSVSSMIYRMKQNGMGLASICILSTAVLVMLSAAFSLYIGVEDVIRTQYPREMLVRYWTEDSEAVRNKAAFFPSAAERVLTDHECDQKDELYFGYTVLFAYYDGTEFIFDEDKMPQDTLALADGVRQINFISLEDYNRIAGKQIRLDTKEVLIYPVGMKYASDTMELGTEVFSAKLIQEDMLKKSGTCDVMGFGFYSGLIIVMSSWEQVEQTVQQILQMSYSHNDGVVSYYYIYGADLDIEDTAVTEEVGIALKNVITAEDGETGLIPRVNIFFRNERENNFLQVFGGVLFIGIFLSIAFSLATVMIMYYKQVSEGYEDQHRFAIMQKVGMTPREVRKSINAQVLTVFFLPLLLSGLHIVFCIPLLRQFLLMASLNNLRLLIISVVMVYVLFAVFYVCAYKITSRIYYNIVR